MSILKVVIASVISLAVLFFSTKIIGNKQMSQLNMFDYINGITIGSIAADMTTDTEGSLIRHIIAMAIYTAANALIAYIGTKSIRARRFLTGKSIILMDKGMIYNDNFRTAKIDLNEFLTQCRIKGFFDISEIETAVLEQNGMISFLPRAETRPAAAEALNISVKSSRPYYCIISDGNILEENLKESGMSIDKLHNSLRGKNITVDDIFAAMYDGENLLVFPKQYKAVKNDISQ